MRFLQLVDGSLITEHPPGLTTDLHGVTRQGPNEPVIDGHQTAIVGVVLKIRQSVLVDVGFDHPFYVSDNFDGVLDGADLFGGLDQPIPIPVIPSFGPDKELVADLIYTNAVPVAFEHECINGLYCVGSPSCGVRGS